MRSAVFNCIFRESREKKISTKICVYGVTAITKENGEASNRMLVLNGPPLV